MKDINMYIVVPELSQAIVTASAECKNPYAQTYLRALEQAVAEAVALGMEAETGIKTQLAYVISNMRGWRGESARHVKQVFKKYMKKDSNIFLKGTDMYDLIKEIIKLQIMKEILVELKSRYEKEDRDFR